MMRRALTWGSGLLLALSVGAAAQETTAVRPLRGRAGVIRPGKAARGAQAVPGAGNQQALARQIRQAFAGVVRQRLNLNDDQARQLQATEQRFNQQRQQVVQAERQARLGLTAAMADSTGTRDQAKIDQYLGQLVQAQHRRADLLEAEQKEMSGYLTPLQRAQYQALHEQLNKRIQQLQQRRANAPAPPTP